MLPPPHRMTSGVDFASVVRRGRRAKTSTLVVHHRRMDVAGSADVSASGVSADVLPAQVGFVVSRAVGGSVVRNRVVRRLRARVAGNLGRLPAGSATVVRALPAAAHADSARLDADLRRALDQLDEHESRRAR